MNNFDLLVFKAINGYSRKSKVLDLFAIFCAEYLGYIMLVLLAVIAVKTRNLALFLLPVSAGLFSRFFINEAIYAFYQRKRPLEVLPISALIKKPYHPGFPSGHSSFFFTVAFVLFLFSLPLALVFTVGMILVCVARIFCGVHWPTDIIAGIIASAVTSFMLKLML